MARLHLFEFEDLEWFPSCIRRGMTDYLGFMLCATGLYRPVSALIADTLRQDNQHTIIDLASGNGRVSMHLQQVIQKNSRARLVLTDKYPNVAAYRQWQNNMQNEISYLEHPVDATCVDEDIKGLRTLFSAFHHFTPEQARLLLKDAAEKRQNMVIADGSRSTILRAIGLVLLHPVAFLLVTPLIRPFSFTRFLFTYVLPVIPFCTVWDGIVSMLRLYTLAEAKTLAAEMSTPAYTWTAGELRSFMGVKILYLQGKAGVK